MCECDHASVSVVVTVCASEVPFLSGGSSRDIGAVGEVMGVRGPSSSIFNNPQPSSMHVLSTLPHLTPHRTPSRYADTLLWNVALLRRERERTRGRGSEREGEGESGNEMGVGE